VGLPLLSLLLTAEAAAAAWTAGCVSLLLLVLLPLLGACAAEQALLLLLLPGAATSVPALALAAFAGSIMLSLAVGAGGTPKPPSLEVVGLGRWPLYSILQLLLCWKAGPLLLLLLLLLGLPLLGPGTLAPQLLLGALLALLASTVCVGLLLLLLPPLVNFCLVAEVLRVMTDATADAALAKLSTPWLTEDLLLLPLPPLRCTPPSFPLLPSSPLPCSELLLFAPGASAPFLPAAAPAPAAPPVLPRALLAPMPAVLPLRSASLKGAGGFATSSLSRLTRNQPLPPVCTVSHTKPSTGCATPQWPEQSSGG
jgi:hypothetical protein